MQSKIAQLKDHYLICGFGRVGRQVAKDLQRAGAPFVVIDDNPDVREFIEEMDVLHIDGRGSDDEVMRRRASSGPAPCSPASTPTPRTSSRRSPSRELRPDIPIVARAAVESSERKLIRAGANEVVSPVQGQRAHDGEPRADRTRRRRVRLQRTCVTAAPSPRARSATPT